MECKFDFGHLASLRCELPAPVVLVRLFGVVVFLLSSSVFFFFLFGLFGAMMVSGAVLGRVCDR